MVSEQHYLWPFVTTPPPTQGLLEPRGLNKYITWHKCFNMCGYLQRYLQKYTSFYTGTYCTIRESLECADQGWYIYI